MNFIQSIRKNAGNYLLRKGISSVKRNKKLININSAESIGIVFELNGEEVYYSVQKYLQQLQERRIRVKALGFASDKLTTNHFLPVLSFDFFNTRDLSWFYIPKSACVLDFLDNEFDICINIGPEDSFPLKYVAGMSKARLKVGAYGKLKPDNEISELSGIYDIMLQTGEAHNQITFLQNVHEYLTILSPKKDA